MTPWADEGGEWSPMQKIKHGQAVTLDSLLAEEHMNVPIPHRNEKEFETIKV